MMSERARTLLCAVAEGDVAAVRRHLKDGVDVNAIVKGQTALHAAVAASRHAYREDTVDLLVAEGANVDALDENRSTPLMVACSIGNVFGSRMAMKLIRLGANVIYVRETDKATALHSAVVRATPEVLNSLIDHGAAVDGPRSSLITPLMHAVVESNLDSVKVLVARGADLTAKCALPWAKGRTAEEIAMQNGKKAIADLLRKCREKAGKKKV